MLRSFRVAFAVSFLAVGCQAPPRDDSLGLVQLYGPELVETVQLTVPDPAMAGAHSIEEYVAVALERNPQIQAARWRVEAQSHRIDQVTSLEDPRLQATLFPESVQTAAGAQEFSLSASQKFPLSEKLRVRGQRADAEVSVAHAELSATELDVIERVKRAYYELYSLQKAIQITEESGVLLQRIMNIANTRLQVGAVSQQDVLNAQVGLSEVEQELIRLRQQQQSARARLARQLSISPTTSLDALDELPQEQIPADIERLYALSVERRPELQAQLAMLLRDQHAIKLAELEYVPDLTVGLTWIDVGTGGISPVANGRDAVMLGLGINVPLHRRRLEAGVREAEARTAQSHRMYTALRDRTLEEVTDLFAHITSQHNQLRVFEEDIIPFAEQALAVSEQAYTAQDGTVDFLQLIENWRKLLQFEVMRYRLEGQLRQNMAALERAVGGPLQSEAGSSDDDSV